MSAIFFQVIGDPKGQPRPRAFARKMGEKWVARVFEAGTAEEWKSFVAIAARPHVPSAPFTGPVFVRLAFVFKRPRSHFRTGRKSHELRPDAPHWSTAKPDNDNLEKAVWDAITQLQGFWRDDSQIAMNTTLKTYGETPGVFVEIKALDTVEFPIPEAA